MKKIIIIFILMGVIATSCDDRLEDLNQSRKAPRTVTGPTLFANGMRNFVDQMQSISVNDGVFKLYSQYWAQTTYPDESQYNMVTRNISQNIYRNLYRDALRDLEDGKAAIEVLSKDEIELGQKANQIAVIDITTVYIWSVLVDAFGHIPYSEALNIENLNPAYDDMTGVYSSIITKLDNAISSIDETSAGMPGGQDLIYNGDMSSWTIAANSLKLRLAMRLADVDPTKSKTMFSEAIAGGVILTNENNFSMEYQSGAPNTNPQYEDLVLSGRSDFVAANTLVDKLNMLNDPRRPVYFSNNLGDGVYVGGIYGTANSYKGFTHVGDIFHTPDLPGALITASEVNFLLAEAAARGGYSGLTMTAEEYYNEGIKASMEEWGVEGGYDDYIAQPSVAYATADGDWKQKIGTQMWIAFFNNGFEGWTTWRRLDFDGFNVPDGLEFTDIPLRMIYPVAEGQLNGVSVKNAADRLAEGDTPQSKIFWDIF